MVDTVTSKCVYRVLDNGVHEFVMTESSRAAVDALIVAMEQMAATVPFGAAVPLLMDTSVGLQPLGYIFPRLRDFVKKYPRPEKQSKLALIFSSSALLSATDVMMRSFFPTLRVRFYRPEERDAALKWLAEP